MPVSCSSSPSSSEEVLGAGELFRRHGDFVARFLWKMGCRPSEMDDAVQEVFLVAHQRGGFRPGAARPTTWLAEIALRTYRARRRKLYRRRFFENRDLHLVELQETSEAGPERLSAAREELELVHQALQKVSEERRAVLILAVEGLGCEEIAQSLDQPVGTVYSRLSRGRQQFRDAFRRLGQQQGKGSL